MNKIVLCLALTLMGCSSTRLVESWKNPDIVLFHTYQVLVVGMSQNPDMKYDFETKLQKEFEKRGVEAMKGLDLFDIKFTDAAKSEEQLSDVEQQLIEKGFDAILFTKVVGTENKDTFKKKTSDLNDYFGTFREDYLYHQSIRQGAYYNDRYPVYYTETSLYCICPDKERELIWRASMKIKDPKDITKTVDDYIRLVVKSMEAQDLIFRKKK
ncbi:hypothetical protein K8352_16375 [Flavobacteriaceae bacterium F89]|uniref:Cardiolipin synthetase n=1 Tax=Cerina litoralis TaxID=2874477 RepID=A0AAE3EY83_9FLAO|nr:hypothetical protein [Cerina litoralis]MCG2462339.1 hypothetical protein [Cerina litoralis]